MSIKSGTLIGVAVAACAIACGQGGGEPRADMPVATEAKGAKVAKPVDDDLPEGYLHVPNGVRAHADCVHSVPNGAHVDVDGNVTVGGKLVAHFDACQHPILITPRASEAPARVVEGSTAPSLSNWIEAAWSYAPANQEYISSDSTFTVPAAPTTEKDTSGISSGQIVYYFPSIQGGGGIVQPVLQWGVETPAVGALPGYGGGNGTIGSASSWTYAAWGVTSTGVYHSAGITVNPGDTLEGAMAAWDQTSTFVSWEIVANDKTTGGTGMIIVDFGANGLWNNAQAGVLEAYGIKSCKDFPSTGGTVFQYPTLAYSTFGSPWTGHTTTVAPSSTMWSALYYNNGLQSGYTGPACGFDVVFGAVGSGTTLEY